MAKQRKHLTASTPPPRKTITLEMDELDYAAVLSAIGMRIAFNVMPPSDSNETGAVVSEICRGWMQFIEKSRATKHPPLDQERISKILGSTMRKL